MKKAFQLFASIAAVMMVGCERESNSARESDVVSQNPKVDAVKKASPRAGDQVALSTEWDRSHAIKKRQYEKMEALAKDVSQVCAGTNGVEAVDALLAKVSDLIDEYERGIEDKGNAMGSLTTFTWPFARDVECYWTGRWFEAGDIPPENLFNEIQLFYSLATKTVDLLQKKVGNTDITAPFEITVCGTLKWLSGNFEYARWHEHKKHVDRVVEKWIETRYDVPEGNPLKAACEDVEFDASNNPNRDKLPAAIYSRTKNKYLGMAMRVVGRYPKWFAAWAEEMEKQDRANPQP